jgi:putative glutamine amidotransferase
MNFVRWAVDQDKPLLGICRGCQVSNVALGGTLYRDIKEEYPDYAGVEHNYWGTQPRNYIAHAVDIEDGSQLGAIIGAGRQPVNSLHHQALKDIAPSLRVTARAPEDGIVEAVELPGARFFLGVQWHPEELIFDSTPMRSLFDALVTATQR